MVFHQAQDNLVALADFRHAEAIGHRVDGFCGRFGEDDFIGGPGVQKSAYLFPCGLIGVRCGIRQVMQPTMNIGVFI